MFLDLTNLAETLLKKHGVLADDVVRSSHSRGSPLVHLVEVATDVRVPDDGEPKLRRHRGGNAGISLINF